MASVCGSCFGFDCGGHAFAGQAIEDAAEFFERARVTGADAETKTDDLRFALAECGKRFFNFTMTSQIILRAFRTVRNCFRPR